MAHDIDAWVSDDLPGFRLAIPTFREPDEEFHLMLAAKDADIPNDGVLEPPFRTEALIVVNFYR